MDMRPAEPAGQADGRGAAGLVVEHTGRAGEEGGRPARCPVLEAAAEVPVLQPLRRAHRADAGHEEPAQAFGCTHVDRCCGPLLSGDSSRSKGFSGGALKTAKGYLSQTDTRCAQAWVTLRDAAVDDLQALRKAAAMLGGNKLLTYFMLWKENVDYNRGRDDLLDPGAAPTHPPHSLPPPTPPVSPLWPTTSQS